MDIRLANAEDLNIILKIYEDARSFMKESGNPNQWGAVNPPVSRTIEDIESKKTLLDTLPTRTKVNKRNYNEKIDLILGKYNAYKDGLLKYINAKFNFFRYLINK